MTSDPQSEDHQSEAGKDKTPPSKEIPTSQPHPAIDDKSSSDENTEPQERQNYVKRIVRWWRDPFRVKAGWTDKAIVFLTLGIVFLGFMQWCEMRGGSKQTDRIIAADERMATAMETTLEESKKSLDATIEQNRLDQRAWVSVKGTHIVTLEAGKPIEIDVTLSNSGKTFAFDTVYTGTIVSHNEPLDITQYARSRLRPRSLQRPSIAILPPNSENTAPGYTDQSPNQAAVDAINAGREYLYIFGEINYRDVFRQKHYTRFCNRYVPSEKTFHQCSEYNEAD